MAAGSGSGAIFTEVLQIGIDTTLFEAQMKQVEALYTASINRMPNLSQLGIASLGPQFQKVAQQFTAAASQMEKAALSVEQDVSIMVQQSNANMAAMAAGAKKHMASTAAAMSEGKGAIERFGTAVERAAFRVPAMILVGTAMVGVIAALKAPIDFVEKGFDNLSKQSMPFKAVMTDLTESLTRVASITAKPMFDLFLDAMQRLNAWLKENKVWVEQVAFALGKLFATDLQPLINSLDSAPTGLLKVVVVISTTLGYTISLVKMLTNSLVDLAKLSLVILTPPNVQGRTWKEWSAEVRKALTETTVDAVAFSLEMTDVTVASVKAMRAIEGEVLSKVPKVPGVNEGQTTQELTQEFRNKLAHIKTLADAQKKMFEDQAQAEVISRKTAYDNIKPILENEKTQIEELIKLYQGKMLAATDITNIGNSKARAKQLMLARGSLGGRGEFPQSIFDQEDAEKQKAVKEDLDIQRINLSASLKLEEEHYRAESALIKKAVAEGHKTRAEGANDDLQLEKVRHTNSVISITSESFGPGTVGEAKQLVTLEEEMNKNENTEKALKQALTQARRQDAQALEQLTASQVKSNIALKTAQLQEAEALGKKQRHIELTRQIIALKQAEAQAELKAAMARAGVDRNDTSGSGAYIKDQEEIARLKAVIEELNKQARDSQFSNTSLGRQERANSTGDSTQSVGDALKQSLHLDDAAKDWANATTNVEKMGAVAEGVAGAFESIAATVSQAIAAYKKGGVMGAAGSLLSSGPLSDALSAIPVVGAFVKPFGQILSAVSSLFAANIQKIVDDIKTKISDINDKAALGKITLAEQITDLQQEKQDAINQLGGSKKKGAKKELDSILKSLNMEIAQLQKQQHEIITNFEHMVEAASLGTSVMTDWYQTWVQINQQVKQYVDAGGSLVTAAKYLNQQLHDQQQKLQDQLNSGNQTAIGDAIQLNTLISQRLQMMRDEAATEFGMINADSIERRTSNAVKLGSELVRQRAQYAQQLSDINNQVNLTQMKVTAEGKIFDINKSIAELQKDSNALTLIALNQQLAKYQDMQKLLLATNGLIFGPNNIPTGAGSVFAIPGEPSVTGPIANTINININGTGYAAQDAQNILDEIRRGLRGGRQGFA